MKQLYVFIMAGGSGERFWPMSRTAVPKHLVRLVSERPLIEETVRRVLPLTGPERLFILTNEAQMAATRAALPMLGEAQFVAEPLKRDTAPATALATALALSRDPDAVVAVLPADAVIRDAEGFCRQLADAARCAQREEAFVLFSIEPTFPSTGFGYVALAEDLPQGEQGTSFRRVARFVEKPDLATAQGYLAAGGYGWNGGIFLWRGVFYVREAERLLPEVVPFIRQFPTGDCRAYLRERFGLLPKISVDYALMEKASRVVAALAVFDWDDVGSWTALPGHFPADAQQNVTRGAVFAHEARANIAVSNGRVIALVGVENLIVVETPDALLVCHRDKAQEIKQLLPRLPPAVRD